MEQFLVSLPLVKPQPEHITYENAKDWPVLAWFSTRWRTVKEGRDEGNGLATFKWLTPELMQVVTPSGRAVYRDNHSPVDRFNCWVGELVEGEITT